MKTSRHFVSWLSSSNRNESSTESKARISFILTPLGLEISICCCTNPNSFFIATMLAFLVFGCCGRSLNFGRFTFAIKVSVIFQRNAHYRSSCTVLSHRQSKLKCVLQVFFYTIFHIFSMY